MLGNRLRCPFIFTFLCRFFSRDFFTRSHRVQMILNRYICAIKVMLIGPTTPDQSGHVSNGNEVILQIPKISRTSLTIKRSLV